MIVEGRAVPTPSAETGVVDRQGFGTVAARAWYVLAILFLANVLNFLDRALPAVLAEPIRKAWDLSDLQIGFVGASFTVVYAIAGIPLGRLADTWSRKWVIGLGLIAWSLLTGLNGLVGSFAALLVVRMGLGIGEAAFAPAANSLIADLFGPERRAGATGLFMLGLPVGTTLAFFATGLIVEHFGNWRAPFLIAMVPGLLLAILILLIREPVRATASEAPDRRGAILGPIKRVLGDRTMRTLILTGITFNVASYAATTFMVPNLQRYFGLTLVEAAASVGVMIGLSGLIGLPAGGFLADRLRTRLKGGRLAFGSACLLVSGGLVWLALLIPAHRPDLFVGIFAAGWLLQYAYYPSVYTTIQEVVEPRLRATAMATYFAVLYLLGGAFGPLFVGYLSDTLAHRAMVAAGAAEITDNFRAVGLHSSLLLVPACLLGTALLLTIAARRSTARAEN